MLANKISQIISATVDDMGFILWGVEILGADEGSTIRIYIDHEEGISVEDCKSVSYAVSALLDVEDPISSKYTLEISSPGMNRRVFNEAQAESLIGFRVKVQLYNAIENRRKFQGIIMSVDGEKVTVKLDDADISFDFHDAEKIRVMPEF